MPTVVKPKACTVDASGGGKHPTLAEIDLVEV